MATEDMGMRARRWRVGEKARGQPAGRGKGRRAGRPPCGMKQSLLMNEAIARPLLNQRHGSPCPEVPGIPLWRAVQQQQRRGVGAEGGVEGTARGGKGAAWPAHTRCRRGSAGHWIFR